jgi:hypothetical protein
MEPQFLLIAKYYLSNEIKKNEIDGACGRHRKEVKHMKGLDIKT